VLLAGAGKSAQTAARALATLPEVRLEWVVRDPNPDWGEIEGDTLPGRQALVCSSRRLAVGENPRVRAHLGAVVDALAPAGGRVRAKITGSGGPAAVLADHVLALTGYTGDPSLYRQLQVHECYATGAPMTLSATLLAAAGGDCLAQPAAGIDTLRTPEPAFFILGAKSYGRLSTFLLRTGYQQVDEVLTAGRAPAQQRVPIS
jgi:hypothetical protein